MTWNVEFADEFEPEFLSLHEEVQDTIMSMVHLLEHRGPHLGRPHVDTLNGSRHANMKELRFRAANGEWRLAFAFDPARQAIFLAAGTKSGRTHAASTAHLFARRMNVSTDTWNSFPEEEHDNVRTSTKNPGHLRTRPAAQNSGTSGQTHRRGNRTPESFPHPQSRSCQRRGIYSNSGRNRPRYATLTLLLPNPGRR